MTARIRAPRPAVCTACEIPLRAKGAPATAGTRRHEGRGLCLTCWKRERYGWRPMPVRPAVCTSCARGWDEVKYSAHGLCTGCYSTQQYREKVRELVRQRMPERCVSCDRTLRHKRAPKVPGTVGYAGKGMCGSCCNRAARRERALLAYVLGTVS